MKKCQKLKDEPLLFNLIERERASQDEKWGEQNHEPLKWMAILLEEVGELARAILESHFEKYGERAAVEHELIQVAAVCAVMWECGKRNGWLAMPNWDSPKEIGY